MRKVVKDIKKYLAGYRDDGCATALCILIVIGSQEVKSPSPNKCDFPQKDGFVTVVVPRSDKLGMSEVIIKSATESVKAGALASHSFLLMLKTINISPCVRRPEERNEIGLGFCSQLCCTSAAGSSSGIFCASSSFFLLLCSFLLLFGIHLTLTSSCYSLRMRVLADTRVWLFFRNINDNNQLSIVGNAMQTHSILSEQQHAD